MTRRNQTGFEVDPRFQPCETLYPIPNNLSATCGYVSVPEDHSNPNGASIQLYVTFIESTSPNPAPEPLLWLHGGPGMHSGLFLTSKDKRLKVFLEHSHVLVFDQRGSGYSRPNLSCPSLDDLVIDMLVKGVFGRQRVKQYLENLLRCRDRLIKEGNKLEFYNTVQNSDDIVELCDVFGFSRVNLYGISYGTRLALMAMRNHPEFINSVILDSCVPIQVKQPEEAVKNFYSALDIFFNDCAGDPEVDAVFPSLRNKYYSLISRVEQSPVSVPISHPVSGEEVEIQVNGETLNGLIFNIFYSHKSILSLPLLIQSMYQGDLALLGPFISKLLLAKSEFPSWSIGAFFSMSCCDDKVDSKTEKVILERAKDYDVWRLPFTEFQIGEFISELCENWGAKPYGRAEIEPVESEIPALVLAGEFDADTAPKWGRLLTEQLANSHFIEFRRAGHGVIDYAPCVLDVIQQFLNNPYDKPDETQIKETPIPRFVLPNP